MSNKSGSGHAKNVDGLNRLNQAILAMGELYNPANAAINASAIQSLQAGAKTKLSTYNSCYAAWKDATNSREIAFEGLVKLCKRVQNALECSGASAQACKDNKDLVNRIAAAGKLTKGDAGRTAAAGNTAAGTVPAQGAAQQPDAAASGNTRHVGFIEKINLLGQMIELLRKQSLYSPNEKDLTLSGLQATFDKLTAVYKDVVDSEVSLKKARIDRNIFFYHEGSGVIDLIKLVKTYIKSLDGNNQVYKSIAGIRFTRLVPPKDAN